MIWCLCIMPVVPNMFLSILQGALPWTLQFSGTRTLLWALRLSDLFFPYTLGMAVQWDRLIVVHTRRSEQRRNMRKECLARPTVSSWLFNISLATYGRSVPPHHHEGYTANEYNYNMDHRFVVDKHLSSSHINRLLWTEDRFWGKEDDMHGLWSEDTTAASEHRYENVY